MWKLDKSRVSVGWVYSMREMEKTSMDRRVQEHRVL
jgi:hypothetical protein